MELQCHVSSIEMVDAFGRIEKERGRVRVSPSAHQIECKIFYSEFSRALQPPTPSPISTPHDAQGEISTRSCCNSFASFLTQASSQVQPQPSQWPRDLPSPSLERMALPPEPPTPFLLSSPALSDPISFSRFTLAWPRTSVSPTL